MCVCVFMTEKEGDTRTTTQLSLQKVVLFAFRSHAVPFMNLFIMIFCPLNVFIERACNDNVEKQQQQESTITKTITKQQTSETATL